MVEGKVVFPSNFSISAYNPFSRLLYKNFIYKKAYHEKYIRYMCGALCCAGMHIM